MSKYVVDIVFGARVLNVISTTLFNQVNLMIKISLQLKIGGCLLNKIRLKRRKIEFFYWFI